MEEKRRSPFFIAARGSAIVVSTVVLFTALHGVALPAVSDADTAVTVQTGAVGYATDEGVVYHLGEGDKLSVQARSGSSSGDLSAEFIIDRDGDRATTDDQDRLVAGDSDRAAPYSADTFVFTVREGDSGYLFYRITDGDREVAVSADRSYVIDTGRPHIVRSDVRIFRDGTRIEEGFVRVGDDVHVSIETSEPIAAVRILSPLLLSQEDVMVSGDDLGIHASYTYSEDDALYIGGNRFALHIKEMEDLAGNWAEGVTPEMPYIVLLFRDDLVFETAEAYFDRVGVPLSERDRSAVPEPDMGVEGIRHLIIQPVSFLSAPQIPSDE